MLLETQHRSSGVIRHLIYGLNPLISYLKENDVDIAPLLSDALIPANELFNPRYQLTPNQELGFIEGALIASSKLNLGLIMGQRYHLSAYGMLGLAAMTSHSLLDAYRIIFRYIQMTWTYMHISLEKEEGLAVIGMQKLHDLGRCYHYMIERDMVAAFIFAGELLGEPLPLARVCFSHDRPDYFQEYENLFGCDVQFSQSNNAFYFDESYLGRALKQSETETSRVFEDQCQVICEYLNVEASFSEKVRFQLRQRPQLISNLESLAERLFTTRRSVQRKLAAEGTSFKILVEDIRKNLAIEYLRGGQMSIEDVAESLGYSDSASFGHAFKRWTGHSPGEERRLLTATI